MSFDPHHASGNLIGPAKRDEQHAPALAVGLAVAECVDGSLVGPFDVFHFIEHDVVEGLDALPVGRRFVEFLPSLFGQGANLLMLGLDERAAAEVLRRLPRGPFGDHEVVGFLRRQDRPRRDLELDRRLRGRSGGQPGDRDHHLLHFAAL